MDIVARGAAQLQSSLGPIEPQDLAIGIMAISKVGYIMIAKKAAYLSWFPDWQGGRIFLHFNLRMKPIHVL